MRKSAWNRKMYKNKRKKLVLRQVKAPRCPKGTAAHGCVVSTCARDVGSVHLSARAGPLACCPCTATVRWWTCPVKHASIPRGLDVWVMCRCAYVHACMCAYVCVCACVACHAYPHVNRPAWEEIVQRGMWSTPVSYCLAKWASLHCTYEGLS